ncbi:vesicular glutamate transporter 1 [Trichonephila inaurata madagascariensis]|uniref:Vesicular glutamate transporter 1 n=1 Tax=Trichonephila inaurata madagascariensis TaxID=2747483 RepID=A0A8X6YDQ7_9ARAC|nr:vesicular glutamate transporter 1 [Trichonephila inaurata madagascariensis]
MRKKLQKKQWKNQVAQNLIFDIRFLSNEYVQSAKHLAIEPDGEFEWSTVMQVVCGLLISSISHILSPAAAYSSSYLMIVIQFFRGVGQGLLPAAHFVIASNWYPSTERGFLNSFAICGLAIGAVVSGFSTGSIITTPGLGGWPSVYYIYGGLGLLLCVCVQLFLYENPKVHPNISEKERDYILQNIGKDLNKKRPPIPWKKIFTSRPVYAMIIATFGQLWASTQLLSVHPIFLSTILHFPVRANGFLTSFPFIFQAIVTFTASYTSKWLNARNYVSVDKVRKGCNLIGCLGYSLGILGVYFAGCDRVLSNVFIIIAMSLIGFPFAGCMIVSCDMSPNFAGATLGHILLFTGELIASFHNLFLVGIMTKNQTLEEWNQIFIISIVLSITSGIVFCFFGSAEVQEWNEPSTSDTDNSNSQNNNNEKIEKGETLKSIEISNRS